MLSEKEVDSLLDKIAELKELQQESNELGKLNKQINEYVASEIHEVFESMKTKSYEKIRKHIYDIAFILG